MLLSSWVLEDNTLEDIMVLNLCSELKTIGLGRISPGTILPVSY
jgi:hypothetical protein